MNLKETVMTAGGFPSEEMDHTLPLVDPAALEVLAEDVGPASAASFARDFTKLWPRRLAALEVALSRGDLEAALEAALSLRTSSVMVGAARLAGLAHRLEHCVRANDGVEAVRLLAEVAVCGELTARALQNGVADPGELPA